VKQEPVLMLALLAACDGGGSASRPVSVETLTTEFAAVFCAQMQRCCTSSDFTSAPEAWAAFMSSQCPTMPQVQEFLDDEFNLARLKQSVQRARAALDGALARQCLDQLRGLDCPVWSAAVNGQQAAMPDVCRSMIQGTLPVGAACELNFEHECQTGSCSGLAAQTCAPAPTEGQACPSRCEDVFDCRARCAAGLRCRADDVCARNPAPSLNSTCDGT
jgi:hypothetical protein